MLLNALEVRDFRNLAHIRVELSSGLNLFIGENGAGKTAVLEAVHLLGKGRSFRTHRVRNLVRHGESELVVRGETTTARGLAHTIAIAKSLRSGTQLRLNGNVEKKLSRIAQELPLQLMLPDVADLVFGPPSERRQFMDWGLFHVKQSYHGWLRDYLRLLKQRNAWLRTQQGNRYPEPDPWGAAMVPLALELDRARSWYCQALAETLDDIVQRLGMQLDLKLRYERGWHGEEPPELLGNLLADTQPRDVKSGSTMVGPHRADFLVTTKGTPAIQHVSRGQGKVISSALNIAQAQLLKANTGRASVFLIDDLGAELDRTRSTRLFELLASLDCQILATALEPPGGLIDAMKTSTMFHVKHGAIETI
jgi:DNA replication and repair protein RecF